jgi:hypothetical protein
LDSSATRIWLADAWIAIDCCAMKPRTRTRTIMYLDESIVREDRMILKYVYV